MFRGRHKLFALAGCVALFVFLLTLQFANAQTVDDLQSCRLSQTVLSASGRISLAIIFSAIAFKVFGVWLSNVEKLEVLRHKLKMMHSEFNDEGEPLVEKD
jgi:type III secretory pathway component EscU